MTSARNAFGSPFLGAEPELEQESSDLSPRIAGLLFETPYLQSRPDLGSRRSNGQGPRHVEDEGTFLDAECEEECCGDASRLFEDRDEQEWEQEPSFELDEELNLSPAELGQWILDTKHSALERLPDAQRDRFQKKDWSRIEFPGAVPPGEEKTAAMEKRWEQAEELLRALAKVTPERRVPEQLTFHVPSVNKVPEQPEHRLFPEAVSKFVEMREAAARDGVKLTISSSFRDAKRQAKLSQRNSNAKAVAKGRSAHMYGLAIDLSLAVPGLSFSGKSYTNSPEKMAKIVRMYRSPVYKWMALNAATHGWFPYRREPWHWEYNPEGFKARFEAEGASGSNAASATRTNSVTPSSTAPAGELVRFAQGVLNAVEGEKLGVDGDLGKLTRAALARFRDRYRLGSGAKLDGATELALVQRALEHLAQASMFAQAGVRDAQTDQAVARFRAENGIGFGAVIDAATRRALADALQARSPGPMSTPAPSAPSKTPSKLPGMLWTFQARTLSTTVSVYCTAAALGRSDVDVVFFAHGLPGGCPRPKSKLPGGFISDSPFHLGSLMEQSGRPVVLVLPLLDWSHPGGASVFGKDHPRWHALAKPASLNALLAEALAELGQRQAGATPGISQLVVAGHSRAYDFLEPLAYSRKDPEVRQGALSKLRQVWSLDTTYAGNVEAWKAWLRENPALQLHVHYRRVPKTVKVGDRFRDNMGQRLLVTPCKEGHCQVPGARLPALLRGLGASPASELEYELGARGPAAPFLDGEEVDSFEPEYEDVDLDEPEFEADDLDEPEMEADDLEHSEYEASDPFEPEHEDVDLDEPEVEAEAWPSADFSSELAFEAEGDADADEEEEFEYEEEAAVGAELDDEAGDHAPLPVPPDHPVPFAPEPPMGSYWPVRTTLKNARLVSYKHAGGIEGREGRMFRARRQGKRKGKVVKRHHAGIDVYAKRNDMVVACERGVIVAFGFFYKAKSGQRTYKLLVEHPDSGVVVNYGEVRSDSLERCGLEVGSSVLPGQPIGFVSDTNMLHLETYIPGTKTTSQWWADAARAPEPLLNPTRYLLFLRQHGRSPLDSTSPSPSVAPVPVSSPSHGKVSADLVRFAQRVLNATERAGLDDDGKLGDHTRAALAKFRSQHGLGKGSELDEVTVLALAQRAFEELAQASMFAKIGVRDPRTRQAIADFRARHGLGFGDALDTATCVALGKAVLSGKATAVPSLPSATPPVVPSSTAPVLLGVLPDPRTVAFKPIKKKLGHTVAGGPKVMPVLKGLRAKGLLNAPDAEIELLQRLSFVESDGLINAVQTWDSAYLSFGFVQWTILWGELQELISKMPAAFARYGIELSGSYTVGKHRTVPGIRGAARANDLRTVAWLERFYRAGYDTEIVVAQVNKALAKEREVAARAQKILGAAYTPAFRTPLMRAFIYESYNSRPAYLWEALKTLRHTITVFTSTDVVMERVLAALVDAHPDVDKRKPRSIHDKIQRPLP